MRERWKKYLDEYEIRARLLPALIVSVPVIAAIIACVPAARSWWGSLAGVLEVPLIYFLIGASRHKGKEIELRLFEAWGGRPTTAMLRHSDNRLSAEAKASYHSALGKLAAMPIPTAADESSNPSGADAAYGAAIGKVIEQRRGSAFRFIFNENCHYGFWRNLLGLRRIGLGLAGVSLAAEIGVAVFFPSRFLDSGEVAIVLTLGVMALLAYANPGIVRTHAEAYALALLRSLDSGVQAPSPRPKRSKSVGATPGTSTE